MSSPADSTLVPGKSSPDQVGDALRKGCGKELGASSPVQPKRKGREDAAGRAARTGGYLHRTPAVRGCMGHGHPEQPWTAEGFLPAVKACAMLCCALTSPGRCSDSRAAIPDKKAFVSADAR